MEKQLWLTVMLHDNQMVSGRTVDSGYFYPAICCYNSFLLYVILGVQVKMLAPHLFSAFQWVFALLSDLNRIFSFYIYYPLFGPIIHGGNVKTAYKAKALLTIWLINQFGRVFNPTIENTLLSQFWVDGNTQYFQKTFSMWGKSLLCRMFGNLFRAPSWL